MKSKAIHDDLVKTFGDDIYLLFYREEVNRAPKISYH